MQKVVWIMALWLHVQMYQKFNLVVFFFLFQLRALSVVKQKGPIEKEDPNAVRKKLSPKAKEQIMKMTEDSGKGMILVIF